MNIIKHRVLVVEDDPRIARLLGVVLSRGDFEVIHASDGADARSAFLELKPHLVLLDVGLPDMSGIDLLRELRERSTVPVIVVSARSHERDKVEALNMGADDYITKPFGADELLARVRNAMLHTRTAVQNHGPARSGLYQAGDLVVDLDRYQVRVGDKPVKLTQTEFRILALLAMHSGKVLTYDYLKQQLWEHKAEADNSILRVNVANIRRKIEANPGEPRYLFTEIGVGYRMADMVHH